MKDIHGYSKRLDDALGRVRRSQSLCDDDKHLLERFSVVLRVQKISTGRVEKYVNHLKKISEMLGEITQSKRGLGAATKEDIELVSVRINESERYKPHTKSDYMTVIKRFYQWLKAPPDEYNSWRRKHKYPPEVDEINSCIKMNQRFLPSDLLTDDEAGAMLQAAAWIMVKGAVALSNEVGPRPGEFLNMKVGDIIFRDDGVICRLAHNGGGKTGERLILVIKSVQHVTSWLNAHPFKDDPEAPLWIGFSSTNRYEQWSYKAYQKMFAELGKKAGIRRRVTPYLFRHTAATRDARLGFTEVQLCLKYGWVVGSKMPRIYLHMSNTDLWGKIEEAYGGRPPRKPEPQTLTCSRCQRANTIGQKFCGWCGSPLLEQDISRISVEIEEKKREENLKILELEGQLAQMQGTIALLLERPKRRKKIIPLDEQALPSSPPPALG
ncbi:MAG: tyrosine-type recombinase/integrase [Thaumarchaeota archaeon]|nr:tyrosine-type recombinase/integrase [Nitrososphaerota archaeon]